MKTKNNSLQFRKVVGRFLFLALPLATFAIQILFAAANARAGGGAQVDYVLTTPSDPVKPGEVAEFDITLRNLTNVQQNVTLSYTVPAFVTHNGNPTGTPQTTGTFFIPAGETQSGKLIFNIPGGNQSPPNGSVINLVLTDQARATQFSRSTVVHATPPLNLQLSCGQGIVAPGQNFTYTAAVANIGSAVLGNVQLSMPVPAGATFISADGGGTLDTNTVTWNIGTLVAGGNQQVHVTFQASGVANTPLAAVTGTVTDSGGDISRASDARAIYPLPAVDYVITAPFDPVKGGDYAEFDITLRNLTNVQQNVTLNYTVPDFTTQNGSIPGTTKSTGTFFIPAGETQSGKIIFAIPGGNQSPPNGATITPQFMDFARGASIARSVVIRASQALNLQMSCGQGTVAPGQNFSYTFAAANIGSSTLTGVQLTVPVPAGASFVSADGGGALNNDVVTWNLGNLTAAGNRQVHVTFQASGIANTPLGPIEGRLSDSSGNVARASDARAVYALPEVDYIITTPADPVRPGDFAEFDITLRNLTGAQQNVTLNFTVPDYTTQNNSTPGTAKSTGTFFIPAGETQSGKLIFAIPGGNQAPPNGATITVNLIDFARGASFSRHVVIRSSPALDLQLACGQGTVAPGNNFTYSIVAANISNNTLTGVQLRMPVPAGASVVSAGGGTLANNTITWSIGNLAAVANRQFQVTFQASPTKATPLGPIEGTLSDNASNIARASDARAVYALPEVEYKISSVGTVLRPNGIAEFDFTLHNLSGIQQNVTLNFTVPDFTTHNNSVPGTIKSTGTFFIPAGETQSGMILLNIQQAPPNGATVTLNLMDTARGASISKTIVIVIPKPLPDFNSDNHTDLLFQHSSGARTIWLMNGAIHTGTVSLGNVSPAFSIVGTGDFNGDGYPDILFQHSSGARSIWLMHGTVHTGSVSLGNVSTAWTICGSGDFNNDGKADILFQNSAGGRAVWLMNGTVLIRSVSLGTISPSWSFVGAGDFNNDGKDDILLQNTSGARLIWLMNGTIVQSTVSLGNLATHFNMAGVGDFNGDHKPDIIIEDTTTGVRSIWIMNGTNHTSTLNIGTLATQWRIRNF